MKRALYAPVAVIALALFTSAALAGAVTMKNGDTVTGKVVSLSGGKLTLETSHMGALVIDYAEVSSISADSPVGVTLSGGNRLVGTLEYAADGQITVTTDAGPVTLPAASLLAVGPAEVPPVRWTGSFEAGIAGQSGNTETFSGNARLALKRKYDDFSLSAYASGRYAQEDSVRSANQQRLGGRTETLIPENAFWYTSLDLLRDEFKDLDLRATGTVGLGRTWWEQDANYWKTAVGLGFTHESYQSGGSDTFPTAELVGDYGKKINDTLTFTDTVKFLSNLSDLKSWRAENDAAVAGAKVIAIEEIDDPASMFDPETFSTVSDADGFYELLGLDSTTFYYTMHYLESASPHALNRVSIRVEADGFGQSDENVPIVPLVTEEGLYWGRRLLKAFQRVGYEETFREKEDILLPSIQGNTITGIDIVLNRVKQ